MICKGISTRILTKNMKPMDEECHQWEQKIKVKLDSLEGRDVLIYENICEKKHKDLKR